MCPLTTLPAGEGPARLSPAAVRDWQPRRKSVSNACERCRRRKIRCDGETPCSTCKRFTLQCVRTQKPKDVVASEHREALEGRIHQLEAQLARHVNAPMHGMESTDQSILAATPSSFDWQSPQPHVNLDTAISASFPANELNSGTFPTRSISIPTMAIDECEPFPNFASPTTPGSLWSATTRTSSPGLMPPRSAPPQLDLSYPPGSRSSASPMEQHTAPSWEFMAQASANQLQPGTSSRGHSQRTSASSSSQGSEEQAMSPIPEVEDDLLPLAPAPRLPRQGIFAAHQTESPGPASSRSSFTDRSRALATTPLPSRFEAETLTAEFVQHLESLDYRAYSIAPALFVQFCEAVYPNPQRTAAMDIPASMPMARFHVFLAMAVAMKVRIKDAPELTNALLDTCYELAMQQTSPSTFWQESFGIEAAQLLALFASLRKPSIDVPRALQPSFSW
ncbi:hypothetical protein BDW02DRAFT_565401 [Decorospora gaudefroyi]|uniref:Zn(2)-C6 fungal-type domain-containing protein n=1 Tax=Decorospora gaudefroyi TaxID=184978 RepID=A0A6A5KQ05_9PLEO|nr:hypothetical protein BDW02DRAFT_565401 [Decorospora gaudefroyi]